MTNEDASRCSCRSIEREQRTAAKCTFSFKSRKSSYPAQKEKQCTRNLIFKKIIIADRFKLFFKPRAGNCFVVREMQYRTPNVLQYRDTPCEAKLTGETTMEVLSRLKNEKPNNEYETLFRKQIKPVNCRNTFDGNFAFNYQVRIVVSL